ncbi:forkhead-associated domain-containing protein 1-like isoform X2 [Ptychodera flava]|uniref:forkhead-associated domain-containing protein 1-like isoform X2 n=1 Tax=Ptychodera flava TaxID=63121 RepID=UPI00396A1B3A
MMKGYLRSADGVFPLAPKATTIGREGCDLNIQGSNVEIQHAVIEHNELENCFVLQDLNTAQGTYVNDCRVQNAAVRLAPGDVIRFGYSGVPHELEVDDAPTLSYPPVQQRPAWNQPIAVLSDNLTYSEGPSSQLPHLVSSQPPSQGSWTQSQTTAPVMPRPPMSMRMRPSSAGSRRSSQGSPADSPQMKEKVIGGWVSTTGARTVVTTAVGGSPAVGSPAARASPTGDMSMLHEKNYRYHVKTDFIPEGSSYRRGISISTISDPGHSDIQRLVKEQEERHGMKAMVEQQLSALENEMKVKNAEIQALKQQMKLNKPVAQHVIPPSPPKSQTGRDPMTKDQEVVVLRSEIERFKRTIQSHSSQREAQQRQINQKQEIIDTLIAEIEKLKKLTDLEKLKKEAQRTEIIQTQSETVLEEQRLQRMGDEISRLAVFEAESNRKDSVITALRDEIHQLQQELAQRERQGSQDNDELKHKLAVLESEMASKKLEIHALKEQMGKMRLDSQDPNENPAILRSVVLEREREITTLKQDVEKRTREKTTSQSLVNTLQRDVSNKDSSINRLKGEIDKLKKEIREKDVSMSAMSAKFSRMKENKRHEEEMQSREKELISMKHKLKGAENKIAEQLETMVTYKDEIEKLKQLLNEEKELEAKIKAEVEHAKSQFMEIQRSERLVKVDLEQAQKRLDRFRNRVVQQTFCAPGIRAPDNLEDVSDDELIDTIKLLIDDRSEARNKVRELKDTIKIQETSKKDSNKSAKAMKQYLDAAKNRLNESHNGGSIKQELKLLQSVTVDESLHWIKDGLQEILNQQLSQQQEIEDSLEKVGFNVKSSDQAPAKYIENLHARLESEAKEKDDIKLKLTTIEQEVRSEMNSKISDVKREYEMQIIDAVEKAKAEDDQKLHQVIEEIRQAEILKREEAVQAEKDKREDLLKTIDEMRESIADKGDHDKQHMAVVGELEAQIEEMRQRESKLKEEMLNEEIKFKDEMKELRDHHEEEKRTHYTEIASYKEQVRQHAVTIVAMEERLLKVTQSLKEHDDQKKELHEEIERLKSKPVVPPKPVIAPKPVIVQPGPDVQALEQLVQVLRRESADFKKEIQDQQDVILGLRRDLAGASARLSDMTGELSEHQKQELEGNRTQIKDMELELTTQRQQMAKLSELVDKQTAEVKKYQDDLRAESQTIEKYKAELKVKSEEIVQLQNQLQTEQEAQRQSVVTKEQEGIIAGEMSAVGAQCRGERHEQVISRQREALAELRSRIKGLEQSRPPIPSHDQALQQVVLLKKELAEMRAQQASLTDGSLNLQDALLEQKVAEARGQIPPSVSDSAIERSARIETQEALAESEKSYLELAKAIANQLDLGEIQGLRSVTHLPRDERERLNKEREKAIELMVSRLRVLHQRLDRKDALLQDYEKDLARLRQAEHEANEKAIQVESLATDVRGRAEENQYLRETLRRTRETLEQEKRLNNAIKNKKTFHMEKDEKNLKSWPRHRCYEDEMAPKKEKKKKDTQREKILRKSYEIESLKTELNSKDQQLCDTTARLINLENSMTSPGRIEWHATTTVETSHNSLS